MQINNFIVKKLKISHSQAQQEIAAGNILVDEKLAQQKQFVLSTQTVTFKKTVIKKGIPMFYYAYYKPVGVECTQNTAIPNNLIESTGLVDYFFPVGRLDKASEGLMILTNDGSLYKEVAHEKSAVEKIYEVEVNQQITDKFIAQMQSGIEIMGKITKPCRIFNIENFKFKIILTEGRNRQIRRMCYKLGYDVLVLKRIAIGKLELGEIAINKWVSVEKHSIL